MNVSFLGLFGFTFVTHPCREKNVQGKKNLQRLLPGYTACGESEYMSYFCSAKHCAETCTEVLLPDLSLCPRCLARSDIYNATCLYLELTLCDTPKATESPGD